MDLIPNNYSDFLYWIKERTERLWSQNFKTPSDDFADDRWICGAKWIGMTEEEILNVEKRYSIVFTPEHREFLRVLHTIDRKERIYFDEQNKDKGYEERPFFLNWLQDDTDIKSGLDWPFRTILADVLGRRSFWLECWGAEPKAKEVRERDFAAWFSKAPGLIPITGHRFQVADLSLRSRPVLSIWGSDIIVYGKDFRQYLLFELEGHLSVHIDLYDADAKLWYSDLKEEYEGYFKMDSNSQKIRDIPYWRDFIV